ncbi:hypothetical protein [Lysinibacillus fusiformis]|uniref:Uncharacterized protein n=1 Tax=Lysinibacillus fusiformis TaxID=28031 RepID=A0A1E4RA43_9BACI|nr:hypothetical protein [Lysinibacillus fusiformis]ODV57299.1 hypothetical protein BG258_15970 [Lysinibacillus fusiformis]
MTKFNVGDKVQILDASKIIYAIKGGFKTGEIYPVTQINNSGRPVIESETDHLGFYEHELKYIQKVSDKPTKNQRITVLENEVAELKLIVHELRGKKSIEPSTTNTVEDIIEFEGQQYRKVDRGAKVGDVVIFNSKIYPHNAEPNKPYIVNREIAYGVGHHDGETICNVKFAIYDHGRTPENVDVYELIEPKPLTPNQQRAVIIEKAKKFLEENLKLLISYDFIAISNGTKLYSRQRFQDIKLTTAKCSPNDVFNEHIGKAIALGRALGLDVSEFEQAVQPTIAVGQLVESSVPEIYKVFTLEGIMGNVKYKAKNGSWQNAEGGDLPNETWYKIINDTNAKYEVES